MGKKGCFPEAQQDPVIQIANHLVAYGSKEIISKAIFTLNTCASIAGAHVYSFASEREMLVGWALYLKAMDPDF